MLGNRNKSGIVLTSLLACSLALCSWRSADASGQEVYSGKVAVIVNAEYTGQLSRNYIKRLYLGTARKLPDGPVASVYDLESCEARKRFCESVLGLSEAQLKRHWMRMILTGSAVPPSKITPEEAVRKVSTDKGALAIVPLESASQSVGVRVVLRLD